MGEDTNLPVYDAIVIGAGFAGIYMLYSLLQMGLQVRVYERGGDVGGTWYWNRYPGACCDTLSVYYSYSFDEKLEQEWPLVDRYAAQPQMMSYFRHVAERFDLRPHIQFDTEVNHVVWHDNESRWHVETDRGDHATARFVITAVGCLSAANKPKLSGQHRFMGVSYHTSEWPREPVDFTGKRVGIIGTGSTGIQAVPVIAEQAAHLTVFQRTAQYALPARSRPLDPTFVAEVKANYREIRQKCRESRMGSPADDVEHGAFEVDDQARIAAYQRGWEEGGSGFMHTFKDIMLDEGANETACEFVRNKISEIVKDPETARKLTPTTYLIGTKRIPIGDGFYETFNCENVDLVALREEPIVEVTENGIRTSEREILLDIIIYATGFDAFTGSLVALNIEGRDGMKLADKWKTAGPTTYLGLAVAGFPNLFTITGPGSPSVLGNVLVSIEQHVEWIRDFVKQLVDEGAPTVEALQEAEDAWTDHVARVASRTLMVKTESWYTGANIKGKVRMFLPYIAGFGRYRQICNVIAADDHRGFRVPGHPLPAEIRFGSIVRQVTPEAAASHAAPAG
jgi:cation diffusion facilitator CzcD-associated flavoprotein CzcO